MIRQQCCFAIFVFSLITCAVVTAQEAKDGWRSLPLTKNGKVDSNWVQVGYGQYVVDGKTIRSDCDERGLGLLLYRAEKFGDCQLRVVYKSKDAKSNAGLFVRVDDGILKKLDEKHPPAKRDSTGNLTPDSVKIFQDASDKETSAWYAVHHGYEVQICDLASGEYSRTGAVYSLAKSAKLSEKKPDEWKTMIITLMGDKILVDVDGERVTQFDPASKDIPADRQWFEPKREPVRPTSGYIGLQTHDPGDVVFIQEISVKPLKTGN
ncbi:DUF1080 domain-containing protein [Anatilimnocola sp. NA78]|uniref:3-keto-disaccharide hydrolase n=1 Tax=Anatilimnocola sp. NA78 TaxID=3415683 RepID=UPI003CE5ADFE